MPLFDVAILDVTKKDGETNEKLVFGPKSVVAKDRVMAMVSVVKNNRGLEDVKIDNMEVLVRPFV